MDRMHPKIVEIKRQVAIARQRKSCGVDHHRTHYQQGQNSEIQGSIYIDIISHARTPRSN